MAELFGVCLNPLKKRCINTSQERNSFRQKYNHFFLVVGYFCSKNL